MFNTCIFAVGTTWAMYGVMSGIVATAHEGEVMGKRMSTVWFPIRMITGIAGMVPIFGGFTMTQAIMMTLTTIGIGIGNTMWTAAINNTNQMKGLIGIPYATPTTSGSIKEAAASIFVSSVCLIAQKKVVNDMGDKASESEKMRVEPVLVGLTATYQYGSEADPVKCGAVGVESKPPRDASSALSFRVESVGYQNIAKAVDNSYKLQLRVMQIRIGSLASEWHSQRAAAMENNTPMPKFPMAELDAEVKTFSDATASAMDGAVRGFPAITAKAEQNMKSVGWIGAGAWFSTFAEVNAAIADAAKGPVLKTEKGSIGSSDLASETQEAVIAAAVAFEKANTSKSGGESSGDATKTLVDSALEDTGCKGTPFTNGMGGTATGNCSLGQSIVSAAIRGTGVGSGGGGNSDGLGSLDSSGFVNPIIMMKNTGDYIMTFSSVMLMSGPIGSVINWVATKAGLGGAVSAVSSVAGKAIDSFVPKNKKDDGEGLATGLSMIKTLAMIFIVLGAAMSIYIPMIPFITWMGAIVAYVASMIEGLAGAPLHALSHLDGDGEGLGQRTTHGYMFYINALARPALMLIGFFVASGVMIAIGTLQAHMFLPAMAGVQGNSLTGLTSILVFIIIFFVLNLTLITACFNLIYVITDQVIGFVGGQIDSKLGKDTEDKANNMFLVAARVGPSAVGQMASAKAGVAEKFAKARAAGAGGGGGGGSGSSVGRGERPS